MRCGGSSRLADGSCLWLYFHFYFSPMLYHNKASSQMALLTSFLLHYLGMSIPASNFLGLMQINQQHGRLAGKRFADSLRRDFGIRSVKLVFTGKSTSNQDLEFQGWSLLHEHTRDEDWIIKADVDEFHVFPRHVGFSWNHTFDAHAYFNGLNEGGFNVVNGFLIDRLAPDARLREVRPSSVADSIMDQFPVLCSVTANWRHSDVRKIVAYKGYIRTPSSHHFAYGIDQLFAPCDMTCPCFTGCDRPNQARFPRSSRELEGGLKGDSLQECLRSAKRWYKILRRKLGDKAFSLMPFKRRGELPILNPLREYASSYHLKWHSGLWSLQSESRSFGGHHLPQRFAENEFLAFVAEYCQPAKLHGDGPLSSQEIATVFNYGESAGKAPGGWWGVLAHLQVNHYCNGLYNMPNLKNVTFPL